MEIVMHLRDLNRAVAAATGESITMIGRLGFQLETPLEYLDQYEEDANPQIIDWDRLESERYQQSYWGRIDAPHAA
ncbi:hypothetical protein DSM3645_27588 [Blastopirellula marina DSM 3645]|uniref:Uncharacterized protein n=2 Tax=Blastopirellula marina TaxID=124 RepID=A3ZX39_9BACT|nr:hypothetical protein DSM3645_27588 [Blastopirellula marina DSM 3645]